MIAYMATLVLPHLYYHDKSLVSFNACCKTSKSAPSPPPPKASYILSPQNTTLFMTNRAHTV